MLTKREVTPKEFCTAVISKLRATIWMLLRLPALRVEAGCVETQDIITSALASKIDYLLTNAAIMSTEIYYQKSNTIRFVETQCQ